MTEVSRAEEVKRAGRGLRGSISSAIRDPDPSFSEDDATILKFHGVYQQDDRDVRTERRSRGLGQDWIFMVRAAVPGGVLTPAQYLVLDTLADEVGNGTLRITTRQGVQWHHIRKEGLRPLLATLNRHLVTTLAACGDVVRNVVSCPAPLPGRAELTETARLLADHFRPRTRAYYEVWVDGERAVTAEEATMTEPIYGESYLPRKFKIALAHPGDNCVDVYSNDVGVIPVLGDGPRPGYTILVGGGLGRAHNKPETYPRLADPFCRVETDALTAVITAIVTVQRDHGNRSDRSHARLKYLIDDWGLERFRAEVEERLGRRLDPPVTPAWTSGDDHLGWHRAADGSWFLGLAVENGRVVDADQSRLRTALRTAVADLEPTITLTPQQNIVLGGLDDSRRDELERILDTHAVPLPHRVPVTIRHAMACVALPTCGLAVTDAERSLPRVARRLHAELVDLGLESDTVRVRMTGCPNGCARPYTAEIGLVGRRKGRYDLHLGADAIGSRLNVLVAEAVPEDEIVPTLRPLLEAYRSDRLNGEGFGDFCHRTGITSTESDQR